MARPVNGAWRRMPDPDPVYHGEETSYWCPDAAPRCERCADFGTVIGDEMRGEPVHMHCPDCRGRAMPRYDPCRDGRVEWES